MQNYEIGWNKLFERKTLISFRYFYSTGIFHYSDVMMSAMASQITCVSIVYSTACSDTDGWKHQCSASLVFVRVIHWWQMNSPYKGPVAWKMFLFDCVIMYRSRYAGGGGGGDGVGGGGVGVGGMGWVGVGWGWGWGVGRTALEIGILCLNPCVQCEMSPRGQWVHLFAPRN